MRSLPGILSGGGGRNVKAMSSTITGKGDAVEGKKSAFKGRTRGRSRQISSDLRGKEGDLFVWNLGGGGTVTMSERMISTRRGARCAGGLISRETYVATRGQPSLHITAT